jgi:hypothetical protein
MERMPSLRQPTCGQKKEHEKALLGKERANSQPYHHDRKFLSGRRKRSEPI